MDREHRKNRNNNTLKAKFIQSYQDGMRQEELIEEHNLFPSILNKWYTDVEKNKIVQHYRKQMVELGIFKESNLSKSILDEWFTVEFKSRMELFKKSESESLQTTSSDFFIDIGESKRLNKRSESFKLLPSIFNDLFTNKFEKSIVDIYQQRKIVALTPSTFDNWFTVKFKTQFKRDGDIEFPSTFNEILTEKFQSQIVHLYKNRIEESIILRGHRLTQSTLDKWITEEFKKQIILEDAIEFQSNLFTKEFKVQIVNLYKEWTKDLDINKEIKLSLSKLNEWITDDFKTQIEKTGHIEFPSNLFTKEFKVQIVQFYQSEKVKASIIDNEDVPINIAPIPIETLNRWISEKEYTEFSIDEISYDADENVFYLDVIPELNSINFPPHLLRWIKVSPTLLEKNFLSQEKFKDIHGCEECTGSVVLGGRYKIPTIEISKDLLFNNETIFDKETDFFANNLDNSWG